MAAPRILLLIPPLTQLNTPYPSTAYLTGFLRSQDIACEQADLGIEMVLRLFSRTGLRSVFEHMRQRSTDLPGEARQMLALEQAYLDSVEPVVEFLQGRNPTFASHLARPGVLPRGPRFTPRSLPQAMSVQDRAQRCATLYLEDLADLAQATVSPHFALNRYAEHIGRSASSFDRLLGALAEPATLIDRMIEETLRLHIERVQPTLIGITAPFPGNVYGAFRIAQAVKAVRPDLMVVLGGGYVNTELRRVRDPRVFDFVDFITLDDGEGPLIALIEHLAGARTRQDLCRTFFRTGDVVRFADTASSAPFGMGEIGCPTYEGLPLDRYLSVIDSTNPMHRLWSEGHWNKLTVAHGCYWRQCTFCDVGLDYIGRYDPTPTDHLLKQIEQLIAETGRRGFHFVDEAAPPAALKALALGVLERGLMISWWGNIRFEPAFTRDLCRLLAASGCIAVTAGLEAASDRLLVKMKKGITVDGTVLVASAFRQAGILVHGYLMYGFPSETVQETIDSLERVRQLFSADLMQSAFWHRFTATAHSPTGLDPAAHGLRILGPRFEGFAENDRIHQDCTGGTAADWIGEGLRRSMLNYLERKGLSLDVREWFDRDVPRARVSAGWIRRLLNEKVELEDQDAERRCVWLGGTVVRENASRRTRLILPSRTTDAAITLPHAQADWLAELLRQATPRGGGRTVYPWLRDVKTKFPGPSRDFAAFVRTSTWRKVRDAGLVLI